MSNRRMIYRAFLIGLFLIVALPAGAYVAEQLQQQIADLQRQLESLKLQEALKTYAQPNANTSAASWCHDFKERLVLNSKGVEVEALQEALQKQGLFTGRITYPWVFDLNTKNALIKFQERYASEILIPYGLSKGTGTAASATNAKLNQLYGCTKTTAPEAATGTTATLPSESTNPVQLSLKLVSAAINGSNLEIVYSKNFDACAYLYTDPYYTEQISKTHTKDYFCQKGDNIRIVQPVANFTISQLISGQKVRLCYQAENNGLNNAKSCTDAIQLGSLSSADSSSSCSGCYDVNLDGKISASDSLNIVNVYNRTPSGEKCKGSTYYDSKMDINNDGCVGESDAKCIIDYINKNGANASVVCGKSSIVIVYPNGGESLKQGQTVGISWNSNELTASDKINIWLDDYASSSVNHSMVATNLSGSAKSYSWAMPTSISTGSKYMFSVEAYRNSNFLAKDLSNGYLSIVPSNIPPTANAGSDITLNEEAQATLSAALSEDKEGIIASYAWSCTGGTLNPTTGVKPVYTAPQVSQDTTFACKVTVTDLGGLTATDSMNILVKNVTSSPVLKCGCSDVNGNGYISSSDPLAIINLMNRYPVESDRCLGGSQYIVKMDVNKDNCINSKDYDCVATDLNANGTRQSNCNLSCDSNWQCSAWSSCSNSQQTRTCSDSNNCGTAANKPALTQACMQYACGCSDVNGDGYVKASDSLAISNFINRTLSSQRCFGSSQYDSKLDVNKDNCITEADLKCTIDYINQNGASITSCLSVHYECQNQQCVAVSGSGTNQCSSNSNCIASLGITNSSTCSGAACSAAGPANTPPNASVGPSVTINEGEQTVLSAASSSDKEGSIASYVWSCPGATLKGIQAVFTSPQVSQDTDFTCTVTVTDSGGLTDSASVTISVKDVSVASVSVCSESDGGKNYSSKGTTSAKSSFGTTTEYDSCYSSYSLWEKYCEAGEIKTESYYCSLGCYDGACQSSTHEQMFYSGPADAYVPAEPTDTNYSSVPADTYIPAETPPEELFGPASSYVKQLASMAEALARIKAQIQDLLKK